MKLIKNSTLVLFLASTLCLSASANEGAPLDSASFQQVKRELWAFGPGADILAGSEKPQDQAQKVQSTEQTASTKAVPEELARALIKYSVEL